MHDRLSDIAGEEVVGEVRRVGGSFFDVGFGRICLPVLVRDRVDEILSGLRASFGQALQVNDRLNLDERGQLIRGRVDVTVRTEEGPYLLQITGRNVAAFYELRFKLDETTAGDLAGVLCGGLARVASATENPLRQLSGYPLLLRRFLERLDVAVRADVAGGSCDARGLVADLREPLRRAWCLVPWPLKASVQVVSHVASDRIVVHDRQLRRTLLLATSLADGKLVYHYVHRHNPLEKYAQVLGWMSDVYTAMLEAYRPPTHAAAMARASSADIFLQHFPGFQKMV